MKSQLVLCILGMVFAQGVAAQNKVPICGDSAGFPPYTYQDAKVPEKIIGFSVDLVAAVLKESDQTPDITLLPWLRCLKEVEDGKSVWMALDATYSEERASKYWISDPVYMIHSTLFYDTKKYPAPPALHTAQDLSNYTYCGIHGYNYSMYKIPPARITTAKTETARFAMLRANHCDFVLADVEPLLGFVKTGDVDLKGLGKIAIPEFKDKRYVVLITKGNPNGERLLKDFNDGLKKVKADGRHKALLANHGLLQ